MNATRVFGVIAAVSGAALLVLAVAAGVVGAASGFGTTPGGASYQMGMGSQFTGGGSGMMGSGGMGSGMMGSGGMGSGGMGMMGSGGMYGATTSGAAIPGAPEVRVTASEFALSPAEIVLPAGTAVNLTLDNKGALVHDLTIPMLGVRVVAAAGQTQTVGLRDLPAGTYPAFCSIAGHAAAGMRTTVVVR